MKKEVSRREMKHINWQLDSYKDENKQILNKKILTKSVPVNRFYNESNGIIFAVSVLQRNLLIYSLKTNLLVYLLQTDPVSLVFVD